MDDDDDLPPLADSDDEIPLIRGAPKYQPQRQQPFLQPRAPPRQPQRPPQPQQRQPPPPRQQPQPHPPRTQGKPPPQRNAAVFDNEFTDLPPLAYSSDDEREVRQHNPARSSKPTRQPAPAPRVRAHPGNKGKTAADSDSDELPPLLDSSDSDHEWPAASPVTRVYPAALPALVESDDEDMDAPLTLVQLRAMRGTLADNEAAEAEDGVARAADLPPLVKASPSELEDTDRARDVALLLRVDEKADRARSEEAEYEDEEMPSLLDSSGDEAVSDDERRNPHTAPLRSPTRPGAAVPSKGAKGTPTAAVRTAPSASSARRKPGHMGTSEERRRELELARQRLENAEVVSVTRVSAVAQQQPLRPSTNEGAVVVSTCPLCKDMLKVNRGVRVKVTCSDKCELYVHSTCWNAQLKRATTVDDGGTQRLELRCCTPDCAGYVKYYEVRKYDDEGNSRFIKDERLSVPAKEVRVARVAAERKAQRQALRAQHGLAADDDDDEEQPRRKKKEAKNKDAPRENSKQRRARLYREKKMREGKWREGWKSEPTRVQPPSEKSEAVARMDAQDKAERERRKREEKRAAYEARTLPVEVRFPDDERRAAIRVASAALASSEPAPAPAPTPSSAPLTGPPPSPARPKPIVEVVHAATTPPPSPPREESPCVEPLAEPHVPTLSKDALTPRTSALLETVALPEDLKCIVSHDLMWDPVRAPDGYTYDRLPIEKWLAQRGVSPITRAPMRIEDLRPDAEMRARVAEFLEKLHERAHTDAFELDLDPDFTVSSLLAPNPTPAAAAPRTPAAPLPRVPAAASEARPSATAPELPAGTLPLSATTSKASKSSRHKGEIEEAGEAERGRLLSETELRAREEAEIAKAARLSQALEDEKLARYIEEAEREPFVPMPILRPAKKKKPKKGNAPPPAPAPAPMPALAPMPTPAAAPAPVPAPPPSLSAPSAVRQAPSPVPSPVTAPRVAPTPTPPASRASAPVFVIPPPSHLAEEIALADALDDAAFDAPLPAPSIASYAAAAAAPSGPAPAPSPWIPVPSRVAATKAPVSVRIPAAAPAFAPPPAAARVRTPAALPIAVCKRCLVREVGTLFVPCSHACACRECGDATTLCFECHTPIAYKVPIKL